MYKNEVKFIYDFNVNKLQTLNNRLSISDIKKCNLHPALYKYIEAEINQEIFLDKKRILDCSRFDYNSDRISDYFNLISEEIKRTQFFDLTYIKDLLQKAIHFNTSYLSQPNNTLISFVYGEEENRTVEEIIMSISHAYYYKYLQKILFTFLDKKKIITLKKGEFGSLLKRIDGISKETHLDNTISTAVSSMTNFFDSNSKDNLRLPFASIKSYLQEKGLSEYLTKLNSSFDNDSSTLISATEILGVLQSVTPEGEIIITESIKVEDELIIDENNEVTFVNDNNSSEDIIKIENITDIIENSEIIEIDDNEIDIPNEEILSEEKPKVDDIVENEKVIEKNVEIFGSSDDPLNEIHEEINDLQIEKTIENEIAEKTDLDLKKKTDAKLLVKELIDLDSIYKTLIPPLTPFDQKSSQSFDEDNLLANFSEELEYQFDKSTISEKMDLSDNDSNKINQIDQLIEENKILESRPILNFETDNITNDIDISETIDSVVKNDLYEMALGSKEVNEIEDENEIEKFKSDNLLDDKKLTLLEENENEVVEVFTDLTYLEDKEEIDRFDNNIFQEDTSDTESADEIEEPQNVVNDILTDDTLSYSSFSEITSQNNMSKIIEAIFDYDMEEYHSTFQNISNSKSENDAFQIVDNYCISNNISLQSKETKFLRSLISQYFKKVYS